MSPPRTPVQMQIQRSPTVEGRLGTPNSVESLDVCPPHRHVICVTLSHVALIQCCLSGVRCDRGAVALAALVAVVCGFVPQFPPADGAEGVTPWGNDDGASVAHTMTGAEGGEEGMNGEEVVPELPPPPPAPHVPVRWREHNTCWCSSWCCSWRTILPVLHTC